MLHVVRLEVYGRRRSDVDLAVVLIVALDHVINPQKNLFHRDQETNTRPEAGVDSTQTDRRFTIGIPLRCAATKCKPSEPRAWKTLANKSSVHFFILYVQQLKPFLFGL